MKRVFHTFLIVMMVLVAVAACGETPSNEKQKIASSSNKDDVIENFSIDYAEMDLREGEIPERSEETALTYELPDINEYPLDVEGNGDIDVEIFLPVEQDQSGIKDLVDYAATQFNEKNVQNESGQTMSVSVRSLESTLAEDFVKSGAYVPEGFMAVNEWQHVMNTAAGIEEEIIEPHMCGNVIGIAIPNDVYSQLAKNGEVDVKTIVKANVDGKLKIGYTNPLSSPTGTNFVVSMCATFDQANPGSMEATTDFSEFQNAVTTVAISTDQMIQQVNNRIINSFVVDNQVFQTKDSLKNEFTFVPFGVRQDYPLCQITGTDDEKDVLKKFSEFFTSDEVIAYANKMYFNQYDDYQSNVKPENYPAGTISDILSFWKKTKSGDKQIYALFVADVSGSMREYEKLDKLMASLKSSMQYIDEETNVGMVAFDHRITRLLPFGKYDEKQQKYFSGAIDNLAVVERGGATSTNDALVAATKLIRKEELKNSSIKPIIILLSDGQTQHGYNWSSVKDVLKAFGYPIYTIGYGQDADAGELSKIAELNGGFYTDSSTNDIGYVLKTIFNAEM